MGIVAGLAGAVLWLVAWPVAWALLGIEPTAGAVVWVAGLVAAFLVGVRLGDPQWRSDPVSRVEARQRARSRFETRMQPSEPGTRRERLERLNAELDERAAARVSAIVERSGGQPLQEPGTRQPAAQRDPDRAADET